MAFTVKDWKDSPDTTTPLSAAALENVETRLGAWSDLRGRAAWIGGASGVAETFSRAGARTENLASALTSGRLYLIGGIVLQGGVTYNTIHFVTGSTALGTGSNQWFCLVDQSFNVLAKTNDDTNAAWGANTDKGLTISGGYTPGADIAVYVGVVVVASTMPTLQGVAYSLTTISGLGRSMGGNSTTGLTNPASLGATCASTTTAGLGQPYAYVT